MQEKAIGKGAPPQCYGTQDLCSGLRHDCLESVGRIQSRIRNAAVVTTSGQFLKNPVIAAIETGKSVFCEKFPTNIPMHFKSQASGTIERGVTGGTLTSTKNNFHFFESELKS